MRFLLDANESGQKIGRDIAHLLVISERQERFMPCKNRSSVGPFQDKDGNFGLVCGVSPEIRVLDWETLML